MCSNDQLSRLAFEGSLAHTLAEDAYVLVDLFTVASTAVTAAVATASTTTAVAASAASAVAAAGHRLGNRP